MLTAKEIQLKHGAPVIGVSVIDRSMHPIPTPHEGNCRAADMTGGHHVVICSEEQIKVHKTHSNTKVKE